MVYSDFPIPGKNPPLEGGGGWQILIAKLAQKMATLEINGDQTILVPMGIKVPKWGTTWEQWINPNFKLPPRRQQNDKYRPL